MKVQINMADMTPDREAARLFRPGIRKMTIRAGGQEYQGGMTVTFDDRGHAVIDIPEFPAPVLKPEAKARAKPFVIS